MKISTISLVVISLLVLGLAIYIIYDNYYPKLFYKDISKVELSQEIVDVLNTYYDAYQDHEFALCLRGKVINRVAIINDYEKANVMYSSEDELSIECPKNILGTIHSHGMGACMLSLQDAYTFGKVDHLIMGIICGNDQMHFYTKDNLKNGVEVEII